MKYLLSLALILSVSSAFAGHDCKTVDGKTTLEVSNYWLTGPSAKLVSQEVTAHYAKIGLKIDVLETAKDSQTRKYVSETSIGPNGEVTIHFLQGGKGSDTAWGLEFTAAKSQAILHDQTGIAFVFQLTCKSTPELE
jgi:hypothetical protein